MLKPEQRQRRLIGWILVPLFAAALCLPGYGQEKKTRPAGVPAADAKPPAFIPQAFHLKSKNPVNLAETVPAPTEIHIRLLPSDLPGNRNKCGRIEEHLFNATLCTLAALNTADYFTTRKALSYPGAYEANPLLQPFVRSRWALPVIKFGITLGNHYLLSKLHKKNKTLAWVVSMAGNLALSYAVSQNLKVINDLSTR